MKLPFEEFQVKGVLDYFSSTSNSTSNSTSTASDSFSLLLNQPQNQQQHQQQNWTTLDKQDYCYVEPTSVLDSRRSPSPPISSSTMSSSLGSGSNNNNNNTSMVVSENLARISNSNEEGLENSEEKCGGGMRMEDWEGQDQSLLRLIMGDVEDPSAGLNKILQNSGCGSENADFHGGFGVLEHQQQQQGLNMDPSVGNYNVFPFNAENLDSHNAKSGSEFLFGNYPMLTSSSTTSGVFCSQQQQQQQGFGVVEEKPQVINPNFMMNHNQVQFADNPSFFVPLPYPQVQEQQVFSQNQLKRPLFDAVGNNYPVPRLPFLDSGQEMFARRHQQQHQQTQLPLFPNHHLQQHQQQQHQQTPVVPFAKQQKMSSTTTTTTGDDASNQVQQSIFDQLYRTAELIEAGNPVQAQGILARLNHQLSPIGKPFHRAAFYTKEALQLMLHSNSNNLYAFSPINFIFKIGAYKAFSEISPVLQFANFTCNQALIEALERFDRIHVIDFDIGFGVQWSSFMQELVLRGNGTPSLKITAVVSPSSCNEVELNFTRENLSQYAKDLDMLFEFNALHIESLRLASRYLSTPFSHNRTTTTSSSSSYSIKPSSSLSFRNSFAKEIWGLVHSKSVTSRRTDMIRPVVVRAEMFGQLTSGLESAWNKLKGEEVLTKENIVEPMRDIRRALLEADVSLPVVRRFVQSVTDKAVGVGVTRGVKPDQQLVKIVQDELVQLMGGEVSELTFAKSGPTVILLAGLQGVGKTTVCAKLATYFKKQGKSCMLVAGDVYRPAAIDQLTILGKQVDVPVYSAGTDVKPSVIAKQGFEEAKKKKIDVVIVDTAGRLQIDKAMMDELKEVKRALDPTEILLVVDAMTGQEAAALVTTFNLEIGITGAILTKLDGDSRGGAALSVKEVSGKPIKLVGRGERMEDLEPFYPDRMAGRILGMGDVLSFVEKAQEVMRQEDAEDLEKKIMSAKFDFNDFLKQNRTVAQMGPVSRVLGMIPGMAKVTPAQIREAEKNLQNMEVIIEAMSPEEREKPELLAESPVRRKRVAQKSGKTEQQVTLLVVQLFKMRVQMKNLMGVMEGGSMPTLNDLEKALKTEEKAPPGTARRRKKAGSRKLFPGSTSRPRPRGSKN